MLVEGVVQLWVVGMGNKLVVVVVLEVQRLVVRVGIQSLVERVDNMLLAEVSTEQVLEVDIQLSVRQKDSKLPEVGIQLLRLEMNNRLVVEEVRIDLLLEVVGTQVLQ